MIETFIQLGLAKNEARIYAALLKEGDLSVGEIATKSKVHRRNVYDSLNRLTEKGLVFEIVSSRENRYQAVDPKKLTEMLAEKQQSLDKIMAQLQTFYTGTPHTHEVFIYKGLEGWKNYLRDILRKKQDLYAIGGKGAWEHPKIQSFMQYFRSEADKQGITFHILYDHELKKMKPETMKQPGIEYRFLPAGFSTSVVVDIFADQVVFFSGLAPGNLNEEPALTVIVNQQIADAFRTWFQLLWQVSQ